MYFTRSAGAVSVTGIEKVKKLTVRVVVQDCTGTVRFTDIMLQGGSVATAWVSHVSEQRYTFDAQEVSGWSLFDWPGQSIYRKKRRWQRLL